MVTGTVLKRASITALAGAFALLTAVTPAHASAAADRHGSTAATRTVARPHVTDQYCNGTRTGSKTLDCWVHEPVVTQAWTNYPAIQFLPGDRVTVTAGGCVQTGGSGKTWKRYVDPASNNDLYHGLISIPGAISPQRLMWAANQTFTATASTTLSLGYEDDGYGDNGYWGHDDGTGNQCKNVGNAWVHIVINT